MQRHGLLDKNEFGDLPGQFDQSDSKSHFESLLTIEDVSALLKVPRSWIYEHTRRRGKGKLPHIKLGKYLRFEERAVLSYVFKHRKNG
jgi:excisionase family DNA binding protein